MTTLSQDPLLAVARGFLTFLIALLLFVFAAVALGMALIPIYQDHLITEFSAQYGPIAYPAGLIWAFEAILVLTLALLALGYRAVLLLRRIVDSVAEGDPFIPENAVRLRRMGWLTVAAHLVTIPAIALARLCESMLKGADFGFGISLGGLLLTLVLFILARVFDRGTAMRDDLEGTV